MPNYMRPALDSSSHIHDCQTTRRYFTNQALPNMCVWAKLGITSSFIIKNAKDIMCLVGTS